MHKGLKVIILLLLIYHNYQVSGSQESERYGSLSGHLNLDSIWSSTVYLSHIDNFNDMYTMSKSMIIQKEVIDQNGRFEFDLSFLPETDQVYRLHFVKKGNPPASIIIGGKEENHLFIIANRFAKINLSSHPESTEIKRIQMSGYRLNMVFQKVLKIDDQLDSLSFDEFVLNQDFIKKAIDEKYRFIADTSSNFLISLYAIYKK